MKLFYLFIFILIPFLILHAQEGEVKTYYPGGAVESVINYTNNVREGEAKFYYENGKIKEECNYVNGKIEGPVKKYYENGNLQEFINIENGKREGPTTIFNEEGVIVSDLEFHEGIRVVPEPFEKKTPPPADTVKQIEAVKISENLMVPPTIEDKAEGEPDYYTDPEVTPQPAGGMSSIYKRLVYPREARTNKIQGTVKVLLYINEWGDVVLTELVEGIGYGCDESAKTVLYYTKFTPGLMRGKPVKTKLVVPVEFKLPPEEKEED